MIAIIDYDAGNLRSVEKALLSLGETPVITRDRKTILKADKVILPGVGSFGDAMGKLEQYGLVDVIHETVDQGTPFLGICLGLQLLFAGSEECQGAAGLGILPGKILKISNSKHTIHFSDIAFHNIRSFINSHTFISHLTGIYSKNSLRK